MIKCKNCGKPLVLNGGKCIYCGEDYKQISPSNPNKVMGSKSKPIVQRRTHAINGQSPYSQHAGHSYIPGAKTDRFGNPQGSQYDLAKDGAFKGYKIVVVDLSRMHFMLQNIPKTALEKKGFTVTIFDGYSKRLFPYEYVKELLNEKCQLWIISGENCLMSQNDYTLVYNHFNRGGGVYFWSDNDPLFADSNVMLSHLFNTHMSGEYMADHVHSNQKNPLSPGIIKDHYITTGIQNFYEGITISNVIIRKGLKPLVYSSDGLIVTAYYDSEGKKCLIDGGWTRLYNEYFNKAAGTERFVVNCAAWLANIERFGYHPENNINKQEISY